MTALARNTPRERAEGMRFGYPVKANAVIYYGSAVVMSGNGAAPASTATNLVTLGVSKHDANRPVDNTGGADGAKTVYVERGVFGFANSADADEVLPKHAGLVCYWVDDNTVALTDGDSGGGATRSVAGKVMSVNNGYVFVDLR